MKLRESLNAQWIVHDWPFHLHMYFSLQNSSQSGHQASYSVSQLGVDLKCYRKVQKHQI
jgi:hypothetical protein